jgi:hypothetical protein
VRVLVRPADGFERLGFVPDALHAHDPSSTEGEKHAVGVITLDSARPALAVLDDSCDNRLPDRVVRIEIVNPCPEVSLG